MPDASRSTIELVLGAFSAFNAADLDRCTAFLTEDFAINIAGMPYTQRGRAAWRSNAEVMQAAFPGVQAHVDDIFATVDRVAVRLTFHGQHRGDFQGIAPTGRDVAFMSLEHYHVHNGLLAEEWICSDLSTLMGQLIEPIPPVG